MGVLLRSIELLRAEPDDQQRYLVLADQLMDAGDVRGELITLQVAGRDREAEKLLKRHAKRLLGGLWTATATTAFEWRYGFIRRAVLWSTAQAVARPLGRRLPRQRSNRLLKRVVELLSLESALLLEELVLATPFDSQLFLWDAGAKVAEVKAPSLRLLELRDLDQGALPEWEPTFVRTLRWRSRMLTLRSDSLQLEPFSELFDQFGGPTSSRCSGAK